MRFFILICFVGMLAIMAAAQNVVVAPDAIDDIDNDAEGPDDKDDADDAAEDDKPDLPNPQIGGPGPVQRGPGPRSLDRVTPEVRPLGKPGAAAVKPGRGLGRN